MADAQVADAPAPVWTATLMGRAPPLLGSFQDCTHTLVIATKKKLDWTKK
jgi:hypothetical protein